MLLQSFNDIHIKDSTEPIHVYNAYITKEKCQEPINQSTHKLVNSNLSTSTNPLSVNFKEGITGSDIKESNINGSFMTLLPSFLQASLTALRFEITDFILIRH